MKLSVIVCAKDDKSIIPGCLESIRNNNPYEVILVHSDKTGKRISNSLKLVDRSFYDKGKGLSYARRLGARKAFGNLISYTDSDTIVPKNCYKEMIREMKLNGWAGVHAQIVAPEVRNYLEWAENVHFEAVFNNPGPRHRIGTIVTVWDRSKVLEFGFDPFMKRTSEDQDLCIRMVEAGLVLGVSEVRAFHKHRAGFGTFVRQKFQYGQGNARIAWKHRNPEYLFNWVLSVPYGTYVVAGKYGFLTSVRMVPYYLLNAVCAGAGVLYQFQKLLAGKD